MTKTRLYLDVDGVINAQMPMDWGRVQNGHATSEDIEYRIRWAPRMIEALSELDLEIVWCTTWRSDAPDSLARLLNFGSNFRVLHPLDGETTYPSVYWKFDAIQADQEASPSPVVWIDDELDHVHKYWADNNDKLAIQTNPLLGIRTVDIKLVKEYLELMRSDLDT